MGPFASQPLNRTAQPSTTLRPIQTTSIHRKSLTLNGKHQRTVLCAQKKYGFIWLIGNEYKLKIIMDKITKNYKKMIKF